MKSGFKKLVLSVASAAALGGMAAPAHAVNWLKLQGTEPADSSPRAKVWGFIQTQYQVDTSEACKYPPCTGQYIPPDLIGPNLTSQSAFNVNRARIGVRGTGFPLDSSINYFLLAEFGNNAITQPGNAFAKVSDASITVNRIPHARIRVGLFKTPGADEALQGIPLFPYINFTEVTNQLLLERLPNQDGADNQNLFPPAQGGVLGANQNGFKNSVAAFRDTGIEVFDWFRTGSWEHSYAFMVGNGNGLNFSDNDNHKETYAYWASEKLFGAGKGPFREGMKFFVWGQWGKRDLDTTADGVYNPQTHDRRRSGLGMTYLQMPFRFTAEYMKGTGMIFVGPDKPSFDQNGPAPGADAADAKANGWYVEGGWYIPGTPWEVDLRYDQYNRLTNGSVAPVGPAAGKGFESEWKTTTVGVNYHLNKTTRATLDYATRDVTSVDFPGPGPGGNPDNLMSGIDDRISVQLTHIF